MSEKGSVYLALLLCGGNYVDKRLLLDPGKTEQKILSNQDPGKMWSYGSAVLILQDNFIVIHTG